MKVFPFIILLYQSANITETAFICMPVQLHLVQESDYTTGQEPLYDDPLDINGGSLNVLLYS